MRKSLFVSLSLILSGTLVAQVKNARSWNGAKLVFEGHPATIRLTPHATTTIQVPEPVNSVIVGDSNLFQAEYSPNEPLLVFAKAMASNFAQTNLVISTVRGRRFILLLKTISGSGDEIPGDVLVICQASGPRFIEESFPSVLISDTLSLARRDLRSITSTDSDGTALLEDILNRQRLQKVPMLH